jgi:hypothetical protein
VKVQVREAARESGAARCRCAGSERACVEKMNRGIASIAATAHTHKPPRGVEVVQEVCVAPLLPLSHTDRKCLTGQARHVPRSHIIMRMQSAPGRLSFPRSSLTAPMPPRRIDAAPRRAPPILTSNEFPNLTSWRAMIIPDASSPHSAAPFQAATPSCTAGQSWTTSLA